MSSYLSQIMDDFFFGGGEILSKLPPIYFNERKYTITSDEKETVITYTLPGVDKSQLRLRVESEEGDEKILVVEVSERNGGTKNGGGVGSDAKTTKFYFFPGEIPEKTSSELKNGVLTIRIPKEEIREAKKMILEVPVL